MPGLLHLNRGVFTVILAREQDASLLQSVASAGFETFG